MEIENFLSKNNSIKIERRKTLNYLAFIKFLAMIKIIKWHIIKWDKRTIDYGSRMCEILFISSGFLVGYNYYKRNMPCDFENAFKYSYKHLRNFYPLEFILIIYYYISRPKSKFNTSTKIERFFANILMIKSWSRYKDLAFSINAVSWFLSALIFIYFLVPILLCGIKKIKTSIILLMITVFIRVSIEEIDTNSIYKLYNACLHHDPIIRMFDFYIGMLLIPMYFSIKYHFDKFKNNECFKFVFTCIQILYPILIYYIMLIYNNKLHRCYFVLISSVFVFVVSFDYGYLSILFAKKIFVKIMSCQMEMYLIQTSIDEMFHNLFYKNKLFLYFHIEIQFMIKLIIIFTFGFLYRILLKEKFAKIFDSVLIKMKSILL